MTLIRRKFFVASLATAFTLGFFAFQALPALACGGLVAPDGDVRLARATTFVAWHDGIEHYLTTFTYQETNSGASVGLMETLPVNHERLEVVIIRSDNL